MIKVLLCDIDGTLLSTKNTVNPKINRFYNSIKDIFKVESIYDRQKFNGWTDYQILLEMIKPFGIKKFELDRSLDQIAQSMIKGIKESSKGENFFPAISSVKEFLQEVHTLPIYKGVFTGNLSRVGKWKLSINHIDIYFTFALYGDYMMNKTDLLTKELTPLLNSIKKKIDYQNCCVIGDTPEDIKAGKHMGAKTIGVLTSSFTKKYEMELINPDLLVKSLADPKVLEFIRQ